MSFPLNRILPDVIRMVEANSPITEFAVTDLPEQDSPITQRISLARSSNENVLDRKRPLHVARQAIVNRSIASKPRRHVRRCDSTDT